MLTMDLKIAVISEFARTIMESDGESSDDEENEALMLIIIHKTDVIPHMRCQNYIEDVVPLYTDEEFQMHFR